MWKTYPIVVNYDSKKIIGQLILEDKVASQMAGQAKAAMEEGVRPAPLKFGYTAYRNKDGTLDIKEFSVAS